MHCSMLKEDKLVIGDKTHPRVAIKSKCPTAVGYAIQMHLDDWTKNMEHIYKDFKIIDCSLVDQATSLFQCIIQVEPDAPLTGWQLKPGGFGLHNASRLKQVDLENIRLEAAKKDPVKAAAK